MKPSVFYDVIPARFKAYATGEWEPDPQGIEGTAIFIPNRHGEHVDAVAWALADETRWWTRFGSASLLGRENAELAAIGGWPLLVSSTPNRWMLSRGRGVCVLNWQHNLRPYLGSVERLVTDTPELAEDLNRSLGRTGTPIVSVIARGEEACLAA